MKKVELEKDIDKQGEVDVYIYVLILLCMILLHMCPHRRRSSRRISTSKTWCRRMLTFADVC
jgi:hypothetical protein